MNYSTVIMQLPLVAEAKGTRLGTPEAVYRACMDMAALAQESFHVITLTSKNGMINRHLVSLGLLDASLVHCREVFRAAIADMAASVILVHNHPSGDPAPSAEDLAITRTLVGGGRLLGINVLDHVIIGRPAGAGLPYISMRENGLCDFQRG